jgi:GNAT superfamily N-acetyltransferase
MITVREFTVSDLPFGMQLKTAAGWNQTASDWTRAFELEPHGCFVAEYEGRPAGTTTACVFGNVAWIALVLVDETVRGKGIGKALMTHALDCLDRRGVQSIRLDATALGRPLYEKLGFTWEYTLARFTGTAARAATSPALAPQAYSPAHLDAICDLDRNVTHTNRRKLLSHLLAERPNDARVIERGGQLVGFLATRAGSRALHLGPCIARDDAGAALLNDALSRYSTQPVYFDVPLDNSAAVALAQSHGLTVQRELLRMCRGPSIQENPRQIWASFGPEKG